MLIPAYLGRLYSQRGPAHDDPDRDKKRLKVLEEAEVRVDAILRDLLMHLLPLPVSANFPSHLSLSLSLSPPPPLLSLAYFASTPLMQAYYHRFLEALNSLGFDFADGGFLKHFLELKPGQRREREAKVSDK